MVKRSQTQIWVAPEFARIIKVNASLEGLKIIDYTKKLSTDLESLTEKKVEVDKKIRGTKYEFKF